MDKDQANNKLAEFMGWQTHSDNDYLYFYKNSERPVLGYVQQLSESLLFSLSQVWNPWENIDHAFICLEEYMNGKAWKLEYVPFFKEYRLITTDEAKSPSGFCKTKEQAICTAIINMMEDDH